MARIDRVASIAALIVALAGSAAAQEKANLAGTWRLDRTATPGGGAGRGAGVIAGIPIATTMVITVTPTDVTMESDTGSGQTIQTAVYKKDGTWNPVPGPLGWETIAKATVDGGAIVVTTRRSMTGPTGPMSVDVTDVYSVAGDVLTIDRSMGRAKQKIVYTRGEAK